MEPFHQYGSLEVSDRAVPDSKAEEARDDICSDLLHSVYYRLIPWYARFLLLRKASVTIRIWPRSCRCNMTAALVTYEFSSRYLALLGQWATPFRKDLQKPSTASPSASSLSCDALPDATQYAQSHTYHALSMVEHILGSALLVSLYEVQGDFTSKPNC